MQIRFDLSSYTGVLADVQQLRGCAGWLRISKLRIATPAITREHLVLSVKPDDIGREVHPDTIERLMTVPATLLERRRDRPPMTWCGKKPTPEDAFRPCRTRKFEWLDEENEKLDAYADDLERAFEIEVKTLEAEIREAKKALRGSALPMAEKLTEKRRIGSLEGKVTR